MNSNFATRLTTLALWLALLAPAPLRAASRAELRAYGTATNEFARGQWAPAERAFASFASTYTNSTLRTNAVLYQAQSRFWMSNYSGALDLLKREMPAGNLRPEFIYWTARSWYGLGEYTNAIECCVSLLQTSADPPLPLRATVLQAQALGRMTNWAGVTGLLALPDGVFQSAARTGQYGPEVEDGYFLLGEGYLHQKQNKEAEAALGKLDTNSLSPELNWERQDLLCRVFLEEGRLEESLEGSTNLLVLALRAGPEQRMATAFLRGEIFERSRQAPEAIQAYAFNLDKGFPTEIKRRALGRTIDLMLEQNQPSNTLRWLRGFIQERTNEPNLDLARFHLADLCLRTSFAPPEQGTNIAPPPDTNLLASAVSNLDVVIQEYPASEFLGRAWLDRGWCDWTQGNYTNAATHFSQAVLRLPWSEDQAVALLKMGDASFRLEDYRAAVIHYNHLLQDYATLASVTNQLFDLALYQLVQANLKLGDERAAGQAVEKILAWFPVSGYGEQGLLLLGEKASEQKINPQMARRSFQQVLEKNPETPLWPEIQLAIARSYEQEGDWTNVSSTYASIEGSPGFATNTRRAQVEFCHALACDKEGMESNALERMSNVVIRFPGDTNAAYAQNWIGNYHLNHGNYVEADIAFQELWNPKKFPAAGELAWQARLMAGLAAFKHLDFAGARNDFQYVVSDTNAPAALLAQAQFQLGYTVFQQFEHAQTNGPLLTFAIDALSKVTNAGPTNPLAALAYGQLGNCQLAWAQLSPTNASAYASAIQMYQAVLLDTNDAPGDVAARSQAEVGLGLVAQRQNQTNEALMHFGNVLYDVDTRHADPAWVKEAGVRAAALYEEQKDWPHAMDVYRRVQEVIPPLGAEMQTNIDRLKAAALPK